MTGRKRYHRHQRLRAREIAAALASGRRLRAQAVSAQVRANGLARARLGLIVPKRHLPRAVDRSRMRRLLREWFRHSQEKFRGRDLLLRVTGPVGRMESLISELDGLLKCKQ